MPHLTIVRDHFATCHSCGDEHVVPRRLICNDGLDLQLETTCLTCGKIATLIVRPWLAANGGEPEKLFIEWA